MQKNLLFSLVLIMFLGCLGCKNESEDQLIDVESEETEEKFLVEKVEIQEFNPSNTEVMSSVMGRLLIVPELNQFGDYIMTAGMSDILSQKKGPYTVFVPTNIAFDSLTPSEKVYFSNPKNSKRLKSLLELHIVEGSFDSADIFQTIKKHGKMELISLSGANLVATIENNNILISDNSERKAIMRKSDILSSNGIIHVLDRVLYMD